MSNWWFTSDTHFGHTKIIEYCSRPFKTVEEMDEAMIKNWNDRVRPGDIVYHIGDFAMVNASKVPEYTKRLMGQIHLIMGNHDEKRIRGEQGFAHVSQYKRIEIAGQKIVLCHYAFKTWHGSHRGTWNLHGHSHGSLPRDYTSKQLDVGVDCFGFKPISFEEVAEEMKKHTFVPVDHHQEKMDDL